MSINSAVIALPDGRRTGMGDVLIKSGSTRATSTNHPIAVRLSGRISMSHKYILTGSAGLPIDGGFATAVL